MAKTQANDTPRQDDAQSKDAIDTTTTLILTGANIVAIGEEAEILVGGKNYNTALISQIQGIRAPQFRAVSSVAFHRVLDETKVNAALIREVVNDGYRRVNWTDEDVNSDPEYMKNLVRDLADEARAKLVGASGTSIKLRTFINNVVEGFATSPEGIDQLRKRSVLVQVAILSVEMPAEVREAVSNAYNDICREAGLEDVPVAVRSSAAGEDSRKKAFAGLQDTYLNIVGAAQCVRAYQWDCASAYNLRSMTYRREAILDAVALAERTGDDSIAETAKQEWAIENTSLSVCIMRMINPVISGTAFAADTSTGCRGTSRNDLVSIDASYGLGEAVVGGMGKLTVINNAVDTNSGTITLQGEFPNTDRLLWPGQFVDASLVLADTANTILVPSSAVVTTQDGSSAFIAKSDNTVEIRKIEIGRKVGPDTVVEKGVNPGEKVITSGQIKLFPGAPIKIVDQATYAGGPVSPAAVANRDKQTDKSSGEGQGN